MTTKDYLNQELSPYEFLKVVATAEDMPSSLKEYAATVLKKYNTEKETKSGTCRHCGEG